MKIVVEIAGWVGVVAIVCAYALVSYGFISPDQLAYQLMNLLGATGIIINSWSKRDYQPVVLNVVWLVVALTAIFTVIW